MRRLLAVIFILLAYIGVSITPIVVNATSLVMVSDTLSSQKFGDLSNHFITFRTPSGLSSGSIVINLSQAVSLMGAIDHTDIDLSYGPVTSSETQAVLGAAAGPGGVWGVSINSGLKTVTLNYPTSGGTPIGSNDRVAVRVGTNASFQATGDVQLTNALSGSSAQITISIGSDSGSCAVALVGDSVVGVSGEQALPNMPTNLATTAVSTSQINLSWTDTSPNEDGYKIERKTASGSFAQVATTGSGATTYSDSSLQASTEYIYRVRAFNGFGNSLYSNESSSVTQNPASGFFSFPSTPPSATNESTLPQPDQVTTPVNVTNLVGTPGDSTASLSWVNPSDPDITSIRIQRKTTGFPVSPSDGDNVFDAPLNSFSDTGIVNGATYYYTVYSVNRFGRYSSGSIVLVTPNGPVRSGSPVGGDSDRQTIQPSTKLPRTGEDGVTPAGEPTKPVGQPVETQPSNEPTQQQSGEPTTNQPSGEPAIGQPTLPDLSSGDGLAGGQQPVVGQVVTSGGEPQGFFEGLLGGIFGTNVKSFFLSLGQPQQTVVEPSSDVTFSLVNSDSSGLTLFVPKGAYSISSLSYLMQAFTLSQAKTWVDDMAVSSEQHDFVGGIIYRVTARAGSRYIRAFQKPIVLTFKYTTEQIKNIDESTMKVYRWDNYQASWVVESAGVLDLEKNTITLPVSHLTFFSLQGSFLPISKEQRTVIETTTSSEMPPVLSGVTTRDIRLVDVGNNKPITVGANQFNVTSKTIIDACIPISAIKKYVDGVLLRYDSSSYIMNLDESTGCYSARVESPKNNGRYDFDVKIIYEDDVVEIIHLKAMIGSDIAVAVRNALLPAFDTLSSAATVIDSVLETTVETAKPVLQTVTVTAVPILLAANPTLLSNLLNASHYFSHLLSWLMSLVGLKKRRKPWGVVYDAITKRPVSLAVVRLFEREGGKLLETQVTDGSGRFSFLASTGTFYITVTKLPLVFPSKVVIEDKDGEYKDIYRGGDIVITNEDQSLAMSVPLDHAVPTTGELTVFARVKIFVIKQSNVFLVVSLIMGVMLQRYSPNIWQLVALVFNTFFAVFQFSVQPKRERSWGAVFDSLTLEPLSLAVISIFDVKQNRLLKSRLTDYYGRFNFLAPAGEYRIMASKAHYVMPEKPLKSNKKYRVIYDGGVITLKKDQGIIKTNIGLQRKTLG